MPGTLPNGRSHPIYFATLDRNSWLGIDSTFGIGYGLPGASYPYFPEGKICFWGGWGGSVIIVDVGRRMTISYMMNRMDAGLVGDVRGENLVRAAYAAVGVSPRS